MRCAAWCLGLVFVASVSLPKGHAADPVVLKAADFKYLGIIKLDSAKVGMHVNGLAYRASTNTFFVVGNGGGKPFNLYEVANVEPSPDVAKVKVAQVVHEWKDSEALSPNDELPCGRSLTHCPGLYWDEARKRLWLSYGSFYSGRSNDPSLAYVTFDAEGKRTIHGPWATTANTDTTKGYIAPAPTSLQTITGKPWLMFGPRGSTAQKQSWGLGLVNVADPGDSLKSAILDADTIVHWPTKHYPHDSRHYTKQYSDYPRVPGDRCTTINGNDNCGGSQHRPSYETNTFIPPDDKTQQWDAHRQPCWIEIRDHSGMVTKHGIIHFGTSAIGYGWYGNPDAHCDSSPAGVEFKNNLDSLLWPGKKCRSRKDSRGGHAEAVVARYYLTDPAAVVMAAKNVKEGAATAANLQVRWSEAGDVLTLGGSMVWHGSQGNCPVADDTKFDAGSGRLYVLFDCLDNFSAIQVWEVR